MAAMRVPPHTPIPALLYRALNRRLNVKDRESGAVLNVPPSYLDLKQLPVAVRLQVKVRNCVDSARTFDLVPELVYIISVGSAKGRVTLCI